MDQTQSSDDPLLSGRVPPGVTGTIEPDAALMSDIRALIADKAGPMLRNIVADIHPSDIAELLYKLDPEEDNYIFGLLDVETGSRVLRELNPQARGELLVSLPPETITSYATLLASDDAADLIADLPADVAEKVLKILPSEESTEVRELLQYGRETAGGIMGSEFVAVNRNDTVAQAVRAVRELAREKVTVHNVFVVDDVGTLAGVLSLQDLVLNPPQRRIYKIMNPDPRKIRTDVDQEEAAGIFRKYDLVSLPVVDPAGKLVGRITIDDIVDVITEEYAEDVARITGSDADELERRSPAQIALLRLPWVMITLVMEFGAGLVIHYYDQTLSRVILLASFLPIISAISGNTGLQSAAVVVRAMATGHITLDRWWQPVVRQFQTTLILGSVCGAFLGVIGGMWQGNAPFGLVVGVSMFLSINISGFVGTCSPMISKRFGFDPTITAGPFETAFQDVVGISIFLSLATFLLDWIG